MEKRVTLLQLAERLGLHHTTVSRALRGHPAIAESTRQKVRQLAEELGYCPDPYLTALAAYRHGGHKADYTGTLAWVTNWPVQNAWHAHSIWRRYFEGARERAAALGYRLEEFWEPGTDLRRTLRVLHARSIQGVLFMAQPEPHMHLKMDLSRCSAVAFGFTLKSPMLHGVACNHHRTMMKLLEKLHSLGYRRPGLVTLRILEERLDWCYCAAFQAYMSGKCEQQNVPLLILRELDRELLLEWIREHRPDVIIAPIVGEVRALLIEAGLRIPEDVGLVPLALSDSDRGSFAGMDENGKVVGAAAVDLLVGMLHRNERGVPEHPQKLMIEGTWVDGRSVRTPDSSGECALPNA